MQILTLCVFGMVAAVAGIGMNEEFTWTRLEYVWPTDSRFGYKSYRPPAISGSSDFAFPGAVNMASGKNPATPKPSEGNNIGSGEGKNVDYIFENNIPLGANRWNDKLFITVPRRRLGIPSSLNYVSMSSPQRHNVPLIPYPNWETNQLDSNPLDRLVSVYRVAVDPCDRLWILDTGIVENPGNRTDLQPHSIVLMDLKTDKVLRRYNLRDSDVKPASILAFISVDVTANTCDDAYAYLPDLEGYGLVVYSLRENHSWRVNHNYFFLEPLKGFFDIGGHKFTWTDGVFSVALSDVKPDGFREMYFQSMAGTNLYRVNTRILRNETLATRKYHNDDFVVLGDRGNLTQTSATDLHKPSGILFFSLVNQNALGCWNTNSRFDPGNFGVVHRDDQKMIYPCDFKVYKDQIILLSNSMPVFIYGRLDYDQINFRVWMNSVQDAVGGTVCANPAGNAAGNAAGRPGYAGRR